MPVADGRYSVDFVKMGAAHWSTASGDTVDTNDADDFDDSFGAHGGSFSGYTQYANQGGREKEYFNLRPPEAISFALATPSAGTYMFSIALGQAAGGIARLEYFDALARTWKILAPDTTNNRSGWDETLYSWSIPVPAAQTRTRFNIVSAAGSSTLVEWAVIKSTLADNFDHDPIDGVHPRLRLDRARLKVLRHRLHSSHSPVLSYLYSGLLAQADKVNPSAAEWDALDVFENHDLARALLDASLAWTLTENAVYFHKTRDLMARINAWPIWTTDRSIPGSLEQATIAAAYAVAYDAIYNDLSVADRNAFGRRLAQEAERLDTINKTGAFWALDQRGNNRRPINAAAIGLAGLVLDHYLPSRDFIESAAQQMRSYVDAMFDPLGAYGEPVSYYGFAAEHWVDFAEAYRINGGDDLFAYHNQAFAKAITWFAHQIAPNGQRHATFGDDDDRLNPFPPNMLAVLATRYRSGLAQWMFDVSYPDQDTWSRHIVNAWQARYLAQTLLYYDPDLAPAAPVFDPISSNWIDDGVPGAFGFVTLRTGLDPNAISVMMRSTDSQSFHGHADQGGILIDAYGQRLTDDCGKCGHYGDPDLEYHSQSEAHNVMTIDGRGQWHEQNRYLRLGTTPRWARSGTASLVTRDVTAAYNYHGWNPVRYVRRHAVLIRTTGSRGYIFLADDADKDGAGHAFEMRFLSPASSAPNRFAAMGRNHFREAASGGVGLDVFTAAPSSVSASIETKGGAFGVGMVRLRTASSRGVLVNVLFPTSTDLGVASPDVTPIETAQLAGFQLADDTVFFNKGPGTTQTGGQVTTDGEIVFARIAARTHVVASLASTQVRNVSVGAVQYIGAPTPVSALSLDFSEKTITGEIDLGSAGSLAIRTGAAPKAVAWTGLGMPEGSFANGMTTIGHISGRGLLTISLPGSARSLEARPSVASSHIVLVNAAHASDHRGYPVVEALTSRTFNLGSGHLVVVAISWQNEMCHVVSIDDLAGNVYRQAVTNEESNPHSALWYAENSKPRIDNSVTVHWTAPGCDYPTFAALEYSGVASSRALNRTFAATGFGVAGLTSSVFSTSQPHELVIAAIALDGVDPGTGFTMQFGRNALSVEDKVLPAVVTRATAQFVWTGLRIANMSGATFRGAAVSRPPISTSTRTGSH